MQTSDIVKNTGFMYLLKGFKLLNTKGLRIYVIAPMIINIILYASIFMLGIHEMKHLIAWMYTWIPSWLQWLSWLLWILFIFVGLVILAYTYTFLANLIGAPFNGLLAEKAEELFTGKPLSNESAWQTFLKAIPYTLKQQMRILAYYLPIAIVLGILSFVPIIQIPVAVLWFIFGAWMMALQYVGYPMENHRIPFREMRAKLSQQKVLNMGFGSLVMVVSMIPIINLIVMPAAVLGATMLWVENYRATNM